MKSIKSITASIIALVAIIILISAQTTEKPNTYNLNQITDSITQIIVDVRTPEEWNQDGHANCSINIPLDELDSRLEELKKYGKVVFVCRSGNRAEKAKTKLINAGYEKEVENMGAWTSIKCKTK